MKKLLFILCISFILTHTIRAQSCLPDGIILSTQAEIDNFQFNYPNCSEVEGDVSISGQFITNLDGLISLKSIGGDFLININPLLTSLSGLDSLVSIGGYLYIRLSDVLIDLKGLSSLTSIGSHLYLESNILLTDLSGLDSLTFIGGSIDFRYNSSLETLSGLNSISSLGQHLVLRDNLALSSLSDLAGLTSVGGDVEITLNHSLENLNGLENIAAATINNLSINNNNSLSSCEVQSVCNYLSSPNGTINIDGNASGCLNQAEVEQACGISSISDFLESPFGIYPNPTKNIIFISNKSGLYISEISIFDHSGRQVLHTNKEALEINVSMLSAGMYTISIVSDERIIKTKFIVE